MPATSRGGGRALREPRAHRLPGGEEGVSLCLWEWGGAGDPVLLLHGFGMSARVWDGVAEALDGQRVLAPDARGHGDSDHGPETRDWYRTGLEDLEALVRALGCERLSLVGHSMGANVALRFAARHAERVKRLALVDAGPDLPRAATSTRRPRPQPRRVPPITGFASEAAYASALGVMYPRARPELLERLASHWLRRRSDGRFEPKLDPALHRVERGERSPGTPWAREESERLWATLAGARCPLLVVRGQQSQVLAAESARRMCDVAVDARLVELPDAGHAVMLDAPGPFATALSAFLS